MKTFIPGFALAVTALVNSTALAFSVTVNCPTVEAMNAAAWTQAAPTPPPPQPTGYYATDVAPSTVFKDLRWGGWSDFLGGKPQLALNAIPTIVVRQDDGQIQCTYPSDHPVVTANGLYDSKKWRCVSKTETSATCTEQ